MSNFRVGGVSLPDFQRLAEFMVVFGFLGATLHHQVAVDNVSRAEREAAGAGAATLLDKSGADPRIKDILELDRPPVAGVITGAAADAELPVDHILQGLDGSQRFDLASGERVQDCAKISAARLSLPDAGFTAHPAGRESQPVHEK